MSADADRRATLDPGLTALALRGMHDRDGLYPFIERYRRRWWARRRRAGTRSRVRAEGTVRQAENRWAIAWARWRRRWGR
jgi:hypothetical protein